MEEMILQDKPGFLGRIAGMFRHDDVEQSEELEPGKTDGVQLRSNYRYTVTVRRQITSFNDAFAAANGLKRGEQQILNLTSADPGTRQKIVDFMSGVNFAQDGTWEEIGQDIYLIVPSNAYVEVAPPTPQSNAIRN
jgi:cell division inhibitor SepF